MNPTIMYPQTLYHGTVDVCLDSFRTKLLDSTYWRPDRDFGAGFYTTTSLDQAKRWAREAARKYAGIDIPCPCVLQIAFDAEKIDFEYEPRVYLSETFPWARFIYLHRTQARQGYDPCVRHPDLLFGPMADNDTGKIVEDALQLKKDALWFYRQIVRSRSGRRLNTMQLGNQVAFCNTKFEQSLDLTGYHIFNGRRWQFHDRKTDQVGSL
ncbi:DUF3990 domain-containing protein [Paenibacillus alkalitolerans]|uniref:DUF3990 domain-containing protein n=1 Tax=Paenibacillus alkalitolerans TaxID=2799335 RepID=UPI0018F62F40|nr:DUF3990 domain-containing protein [Paenibacillus alkalitolerans]